MYMKQIIHSRLLRWTLSVGLFFLLLMTILRLVFFIYFRHLHLSWAESFPSYVLGLRFDLRIVCVLMVAFLVAGSFRPLNPFESTRAKKIWFWLLFISTIECKCAELFGRRRHFFANGLAKLSGNQTLIIVSCCNNNNIISY